MQAKMYKQKQETREQKRKQYAYFYLIFHSENPARPVILIQTKVSAISAKTDAQ
jgi:hypothetical protein